MIRNVDKLAFFALALGCSLVATTHGFAQFWQQELVGEEHRYAGGLYGGGLSFADFDKDGLDDLFFAQNGAPPMLYKYADGQLQSWPSPIAETGEIKQLTWVDIDNDGDRDLSVTGYEMPILLYRNEGGSLINWGTQWGMPAATLIGYGHSWADYDLDSDLDLFVCTYDGDYLGLGNFENRLYRNDGEIFTDVTSSAGFQPMTNYTFMAIWMDYNRDLYPDLFVTNDRTSVPNYFYRNNGDGTFTEIGAEINLDDYMFAMTATSDDFDNDGDLDIYVTNGTSGNAHKVNQGDELFLDGDVQWGTTVNRFCWGALFVDANRDGLQDLHICSTPHITSPGENMLYLNNGTTFFLANDEAGISSDVGWSHANAIGDFNGDGLADLAVVKDAPDVSSIWRAVPNANHWLKVTLEGVQSNRDGVSSWIDCYTASGLQSRYTFCGEGYLAQNSFSEFLGLGTHEWIDSLVVSWPSGIVDRWYRIPADQQLYLVEGTSRAALIDASAGIVVCPNDSLMVSLDDWSSVEWSNGYTASAIWLHGGQLVYATVTDNWGNRFRSDSVVVMQAPSYSVSVATQSVSCFAGQDGVIEILNTNENLNFHIEGLVQDQGVFYAVGQGVYQLIWQDDLGCTDSMEVLVDEPEPFQVYANVSAASCFGAADGQVELTFTGGTPGYYVMGDTTNTFGLSAGIYTFEAYDSRGCIASIEVEILQPDPLVVQLEVNPESEGNADGSIFCLATGGTPPYTYFLNSIPSTSPSWEQLSAGEYLVEIQDSLGCGLQSQAGIGLIQSVREAAADDLFLFPNPVVTGDLLHLQSGYIITECILYNSVGTLIALWKPQSTSVEFSSAELCPGYYTLSVGGEMGCRKVRLVVVN